MKAPRPSAIAISLQAGVAHRGQIGHRHLRDTFDVHQPFSYLETLMRRVMSFLTRAARVLISIQGR